MKTTNSRREFLKKTAKTGAIAAVGGLAIAACAKEDTSKSQEGVIEGKSNKEEILYRGDTRQWMAYYSKAK